MQSVVIDDIVGDQYTYEEDKPCKNSYGIADDQAMDIGGTQTSRGMALLAIQHLLRLGLSQEEIIQAITRRYNSLLEGIPGQAASSLRMTDNCDS